MQKNTRKVWTENSGAAGLENGFPTVPVSYKPNSCRGGGRGAETEGAFDSPVDTGGSRPVPFGHGGSASNWFVQKRPSTATEISARTERLSQGQKENSSLSLTEVHVHVHGGGRLGESPRLCGSSRDSDVEEPTADKASEVGPTQRPVFVIMSRALIARLRVCHCQLFRDWEQKHSREVVKRLLSLQGYCSDRRCENRAAHFEASTHVRETLICYPFPLEVVLLVYSFLPFDPGCLGLKETFRGLIGYCPEWISVPTFIPPSSYVVGREDMHRPTRIAFPIDETCRTHPRQYFRCPIIEGILPQTRRGHHRQVEILLRDRTRTRKEISLELSRGNIELNPGPVKAKPKPKAPPKTAKQLVEKAKREEADKTAANLCANRGCRTPIPPGDDLCQKCIASRCTTPNCGNFTKKGYTTCKDCFHRSHVTCSECRTLHRRDIVCPSCRVHADRIVKAAVQAARTKELEDLSRLRPHQILKAYPQAAPLKHATNAQEGDEASEPSDHGQDIPTPRNHRPCSSDGGSDSSDSGSTRSTDRSNMDTPRSRTPSPKSRYQAEMGYCATNLCFNPPGESGLCHACFDRLESIPLALKRTRDSTMQTQTLPPRLEKVQMVYDQIHYLVDCNDILTALDIPTYSSCGEIVAQCCERTLPLIVKEDGVCMYSRGIAGLGVMLEYSTRMNRAHVSLINFTSETFCSDNECFPVREGEPSTLVQSRVGRFDWQLLAVATHTALRRSAPLLPAVAAGTIGVHTALAIISAVRIPEEATPLGQHWEHQLNEELGGAVMEVLTVFGVDLQRASSAVRRNIQSGITEALQELARSQRPSLSRWITHAWKAPVSWTRQVIMKFFRNFTFNIGHKAILAIVMLPIVAYFISNILPRISNAIDNIDLPLDRPQLGEVITIMPGLRSRVPLHSLACCNFRPLTWGDRIRSTVGRGIYRHCTCGGMLSSNTQFSEFLRGRTNTSDPESFRAAQIAFHRTATLAGTVLPPGHEETLAHAMIDRARTDAIQDVGSHIAPHRSWFHLRPHGCLVCGREGVRCTHQPNVCHCGMKNVHLRGERLCGLCDRRRNPRAFETRMTTPSDARLIRSFHRGDAVCVGDRVIPHAVYATPCYTCVKSVDLPPRDSGPLITRVTDAPVTRERFGAQFNGISFGESLPFNAQPDTAGITASIANRQAYCANRPGTPGSRRSAHHLKLLQDAVDAHHSDIMQGLTDRPIPPLPRSDWYKRFPPARRAAIQKDMEHYRRFGLNEKDMERVCFVKNELICKGTYLEIHKGNVSIEKLIRSYQHMVEVFDREGFYTPSYYANTTAKQRKVHSRLHRGTRWFYNTATKSVISANAVQNLSMAYCEQKARWAAPRNITSYRTFKPSGITGPAFVAWLDRAKKHFSRNRLFHITCGQNSLGIGKWFDQCLRDGFDNFGDGDAVKFDASVDDVHYDIIHGIYRRLETKHDVDFWRVLNNMRRHKAVSGARKGDRVWWEQSGDASRGSGDNDTTIGNTLLAICLHYFAVACWWAERHNLEQLPSPRILEQYFRIAVVGDDVVIASRLSKATFNATMLELNYARVGFEYELNDRSSVYAVSFMGSSPFPARLAGKRVTTMVPEMPRWLPKIGVTANANIEPMEWCRSVGLGWAPTAACHPIMRPIIGKYLECTGDCKSKAFDHDQVKRSAISQIPLEQDSLAYHAIMEKYQVARPQVEHLERVVWSVKTLPAMVATRALAGLI